jgi:hypothetical protein
MGARDRHGRRARGRALAGPPRGGRTIGSAVYDAYARDTGLTVVRDEPGPGC